MFDFNEGNLNSIIEKSIKISLKYLSRIHQRVYKLLNVNEIQMRDLAVDAVSSLFISDGQDSLPIKKAFDNWQPAITTEEEFSFFLHKVVTNRTEQHISKVLKETDPPFNVILNSMNYLIKKNRYGKTKYFGAVYIIQNNSIRISGKVINLDEFDKIPAEYFKDEKNILKNIFTYLVNETNYFPAIPLNALILRYKEIKSTDYSFSEIINNPAEDYEFNDSIKNCLREVKEKLYNSYVIKNKLTEDEAGSLYKALEDMTEDLKDGGINPGLYEYLKPYFEGLSVEDYKAKYHNILEYLLKVMKINIIQEIQK